MTTEQPTTEPSTAEQPATEQPATEPGRPPGWRRRWVPLRRWVARRRGRTGVLAGLVVGLLVGAALPGLSERWRDTAAEPGELVILSGRDDGAGEQRQALIGQWNATHPANPARIEELPGVADAQHSEMVARAQSGRGGVDVYNLDVTWIAEFAARDFIQPLDESVVDTSGFLAAPLGTCRYADQLWALPFNTDAGLLYYRTDLVDHAPTSWSRLVDDVEQALGTGAPPGGSAPVGTPGSGPPRPIAGYAAQLADYEGLTVNALEAIWAAGGDVVNSRGRVVIDSDEARQGLRRLSEGLRSDPKVILPQALDFDETRSTTAFRDGQVVFMRNWPVAHRSLMVTPDADPTTSGPAGAPGPSSSAAAGTPAVPFAVARLPGSSVLGGQDLAIARDSRRPRAAAALIEFLTSAYAQQLLFERGGFAATREVVYTDTEIRKRHGYAEALRQAVEYARPRPVTPHYAQFSQAFRAVVLEALRREGELPPDATDRLRAALDGR